MKIAIMQPYFFPYIGYFQLIAAVDQFIVYDNIKYTKKGWVNRNRMLRNGSGVTFSLPIKGGSDSLDVRERRLSSDFNRKKLLDQFHGAYHRAPYFAEVFPVIEEIISHDDNNLFGYIYHSIIKICQYLDISAEIMVSSTVPIHHDLKGEEKVLAFCRQIGARTYINAIGGIELYSRETFLAHGIELRFIKSKMIEYPQFANSFVPWLSIIDVMMFNRRDELRRKVVQCYDLI